MKFHRLFFFLCLFSIAYGLEFDSTLYDSWPLKVSVSNPFIITGIITHQETDSCKMKDYLSPKEIDLFHGRIDKYIKPQTQSPNMCCGGTFFKKKMLLLKADEIRMRWNNGNNCHCPSTVYFVKLHSNDSSIANLPWPLSFSYKDGQHYECLQASRRDFNERLLGQKIVIFSEKISSLTDLLSNKGEVYFDDANRLHFLFIPESSLFIHSFSAPKDSLNCLKDFCMLLGELNSLDNFNEKITVVKRLAKLPIFEHYSKGQGRYRKMIKLNFPNATEEQKHQLLALKNLR